MNVLTLLVAIALAETPEELLEQNERPTMSQISEIVRHHPKNPFRKGGSLSYRAQKILESDAVPTAIASFERAFPGATFYELGRDAVFLGDVIDAFWIAGNQDGRVKRLDASHPSFNGDDKLTYAFLKTNAIDMNGIEKGFPHVIFDTTSFSQHGGVGGMSQSVQLIRAGYLAYSALGKDPKHLIPHFNFISVGGYYRSPDMLSQPLDLDDFFHRQKESTRKTGFTFPLYCDLSSFTYTPEWHQIFGPFTVIGDGVVAPHGSVSSEFLRKEILAEMVDVYRVVSHPRFQGAVRAAALLLGYHFPDTRTQWLTFLTRDEHQLVRAKLAEAHNSFAQRTEVKHSPPAHEKVITRTSRHEIDKLIDLSAAWPNNSPFRELPPFIQNVYFTYRSQLANDPVIALRKAVDKARLHQMDPHYRDILLYVILHESFFSVKITSDQRQQLVDTVTDLAREYETVAKVLELPFPYRSDFPQFERIRLNHAAVMTQLHCAKAIELAKPVSQSVFRNPLQ